MPCRLAQTNDLQFSVMATDKNRLRQTLCILAIYLQVHSLLRGNMKC